MKQRVKFGRPVDGKVHVAVDGKDAGYIYGSFNYDCSGKTWEYKGRIAGARCMDTRLKSVKDRIRGAIE